MPHANFWSDAGWAPEDDSFEWHSSGWGDLALEAKAFKEAGFLSPLEAYSYYSVGCHNPKDAFDFKSKGVSPNTAAGYCQKSVTPFEAYMEEVRENEERPRRALRAVEVFDWFKENYLSANTVGFDKCFYEAIDLIRRGDYLNVVPSFLTGENGLDQDAKTCLLISGCVYIKCGSSNKSINYWVEKAIKRDPNLRCPPWAVK